MAQKKERLTQILGGSLLLFRSILGAKWADFGRFGYVALPLRLRGSSGAFSGGALMALYLLYARLFVVPGIGIPPIIKVAQNGVK